MKCFAYSLSVSLFLASCVTSKAVQKPGISVELSAVDSKAGIVKVSVKNTGPSAINLFKRGTFLDAGPVRKVDAFSNGKYIPLGTLPSRFHRYKILTSHVAGETANFLGIKTVVQMTNLTQDAFEHIEKGKSIQFTVNVAETHDLSAGGTYQLQSSGQIPYTDDFATNLDSGKSLAFKSNKLKLKINGKAAAKAKKDYSKMKLAKRDDCGGNRGSLESALAMCSWMAANAANAAFNGDAGKFAEYFKTTDGGTRTAVGNRYNAIATECGAVCILSNS
jgi:deuterolysin